MEANYIALVNEEYAAEPVAEQAWLDQAATWVADAASAIETRVMLGTTKLAARVITDTTKLVNAMPAQWEQSKAKAERRMDERLRARGLIK